MSVERTVTFSLSPNVDEFLKAYAQLLKYKSVEDFLKEELQYLFDKDVVKDRFNIYFGNEVTDEILRRYNFIAKKETRAK